MIVRAYQLFLYISSCNVHIYILFVLVLEAYVLGIMPACVMLYFSLFYVHDAKTMRALYMVSSGVLDRNPGIAHTPSNMPHMYLYKTTVSRIVFRKFHIRHI